MQPLGRYLPQQFTHVQPLANSDEDLESVRSLEAVPSPEHADTYEPDENLAIARLASLYPAIALQDISQIKATLPMRWNDEDKAKYLTVSSDGLRVVHRSADNPAKVAQNATANASAVRANNFIPSACGVYYFEIVIKESPSGCLGIGVCQKNVQTNRLPGWDTCSYGYHGDDGHFFCSSGNGKPYGEKFSTGDTIGCGINLLERNIFFTKNGAHQGIAEENVNFGSELYPVVGMQSPHEKIDVNFGQVPFVYDIHEQIEKTRKFVIKLIEATELQNIEKRDWCHNCVQNYLQIEGYSKTLESFNRFIPEPAVEPVERIQLRKQIMDLIKSHKSAEAIEIIERTNPMVNRHTLLERKQTLLLLKVQAFVEGACRFIVNESVPKSPKMTNGTSHSSLTNGNSQPSTSAAPPTQNPHKRSRSNHSENDAPSRKVQSARLSVASRLSSSSNDHPSSSKNGTHITNGNGVAFHEVREQDQITNGDISHSDHQYSGDYPPEDKAKLEDLLALGRDIAEEARTGAHVDDDFTRLVEDALPCIYLSKEAIRNHPYLQKSHVNMVAQKVNDYIMVVYYIDHDLLRPSDPILLTNLVKMWKSRKQRFLEHDSALAVFTNDAEIIYGSSSEEEEEDDCSTDTSEGEESESDVTTYSTTTSEESETEELSDEEEEESSSEGEGMDADQPTHSRAPIAAAH